jgi:hypothetical protein
MGLIIVQPLNRAPRLSDTWYVTQFLSEVSMYARLWHPKVKEPSSRTKRKHCWDVFEPTDENADPKQGTDEWSKEAFARISWMNKMSTHLLRRNRSGKSCHSSPNIIIASMVGSLRRVQMLSSR